MSRWKSAFTALAGVAWVVSAAAADPGKQPAAAPAAGEAKEAKQARQDQETKQAQVDSRIELLKLTRAGKQLNRVEVQTLEVELQEQPDDLEARTRLVAFYANDRVPESQQALRRHVLWIIEHHPDAPICATQLCALNRQMEAGAYEQGRELWLKHAEERPTDTTMLSNAARFFLRNDQELAERMLLKAQAAEPQSAEWPRRLAGLYTLLRRYGDPDSRRVAAARSFEQWQAAQRLTTDELGRLRLLPTLARAAFDADDFEAAQEYARQALAAVERLKESGSHGEAVHYGHLVLGRIALRQEKLDEAKQHLLESARTPGSPKLSAFGPNMSLALEIYKQGETEAVLDFLELCADFWGQGKPKLDVWSEEIKAGRTPAFGPNLVF